MITYLSILYITRYFFHRWNKIIRRINGLDLLHWSTKMQAPHFVQVNKRQTQTPIGFKICLKLHSDLYDPFFFEIFYNISIQKRLNENSNKIWREINNMMDYKFKKILDSLWDSKYKQSSTALKGACKKPITPANIPESIALCNGVKLFRQPLLKFCTCSGVCQWCNSSRATKNPAMALHGGFPAKYQVSGISSPYISSV